MAAHRLTRELWLSIEDVYAAILEHPFITGLTHGSLDPEAFRFYVIQDALYLREFARALAATASRATDDDDILMFCRHGAGALEVERTLHEGFVREFRMSDHELAATPMAPTTLAYTSYLLSVACTGSFAEAVAALLPCYWIYAEVGQTLQTSGSADPRYQRWIDTYSGEEFAAIVAEVLALTDRLGAAASAGERERMKRHFATTSRYEWMFWEMGYRQETWPI